MNLKKILQNIHSNAYVLRRQFLEDLTLMLKNSMTYNQENHPITIAAKTVGFIYIVSLFLLLKRFNTN